MFHQKPPRLVTISILTTITIVSWVFFSLYGVLTQKPDVKVPDELLKEINPTLDTTTLNLVQSRLFYEEGQVERIPGDKLSPGVQKTPILFTPTPTLRVSKTAAPTPRISGGVTISATPTP